MNKETGFVGLPKDLATAIYNVLGQMPAAQSRNVLNGIDRFAFQCQPPVEEEIPVVDLEEATKEPEQKKEK